MASRDNQALLWSSEGGSCKADSAGFWWASMPFGERVSSAVFVENKDEIEKDWDAIYGDRKIELVFIGQYLDKEKLVAQLNDCVLTEDEIVIWKNKEFSKEDQWPIAR